MDTRTKLIITWAIIFTLLAITFIILFALHTNPSTVNFGNSKYWIVNKSTNLVLSLQPNSFEHVIGSLEPGNYWEFHRPCRWASNVIADSDQEGLAATCNEVANRQPNNFNNATLIWSYTDPIVDDAKESGYVIKALQWSQAPTDVYAGKVTQGELPGTDYSSLIPYMLFFFEHIKNNEFRIKTIDGDAIWPLTNRVGTELVVGGKELNDIWHIEEDIPVEPQATTSESTKFTGPGSVNRLKNAIAKRRLA